MNRDLLAGDGLMNPSRKCPARMDQLRFTFGEIPPKEREDYRELQSTIEKVEALRLVTFELGVLSQAVSQCQIDVSNNQREVLPLIRETHTLWAILIMASHYEL